MASYLTKEEMDMTREQVNLQIVLGLKTCKTCKDVMKLLDDVREHERDLSCRDLRRFSDADGNPD